MFSGRCEIPPSLCCTSALSVDEQFQVFSRQRPNKWRCHLGVAVGGLPEFVTHGFWEEPLCRNQDDMSCCRRVVQMNAE